MDTIGVVLVGLGIAVGVLGVVVPLLPGTLLVLAAIAVWAVAERTTLGWVVLGVVTALAAATTVAKYLWPVRRMRRAEVSNATLLAGGLLGIVGFFVIPVLGLPLGFVGGVYLAELARRRHRRVAWRATVEALKGVGLSMLIELTGALAAATVWLGAVLLG